MCFTLSYKVTTIPWEGDGNIQNCVGPICSGVGSFGSLSVLRYNDNVNVLSVIWMMLFSSLTESLVNLDLYPGH